MKILLVQDRLRSGGTERQTILLANAFAAQGHEATLLTFRPGGPLAATVSPAVRCLSLQQRDLGLDWWAPGLGRTAVQAAPDVVLGMGRMANCRMGDVADRVARTLPRTVVIGTMRTGKRLPWLFRRSLRRVAHVVANSGEARDTLVRTYGIEADRISVIHNSLVFPPASDARDDALRAANGAGPTTNVLLCVAMFRPEKNQRALVEMAAGLPADGNWQLWLAGEGPARAACERRATELGLGGRVRFLGFQSAPADLYRAADIAVHASRSEALSNFLIEAQAHGLPAVACAAQGIAECFLPGETGWIVPPGDPAAFRAALAPLLHASPAERAARAHRAAEHARRTFEPAAQVAAYLALFDRLRGEAGR